MKSPLSRSKPSACSYSVVMLAVGNTCLFTTNILPGSCATFITSYSGVSIQCCNYEDVGIICVMLLSVYDLLASACLLANSRCSVKC